MAEYGDEERHSEGDDSADEATTTTAAAVGGNSSLVGKMRSSVSNMLPNSLSKWFSPSSNNNNNNNNNSSSNNNNDSANGRHSTIKRTHAEAQANTPHAKIERRSEMLRRRIEVNDYAEDDDEDDADGGGGGDGNDLEDQEGDESNHSDDVPNDGAQRRRQFNLLSPIEPDQPIPKRRRTSLDGTMISSRPLIASTPALPASRIVNNHYEHQSLYPDQNRRELNYNFYASMASTTNYEQQNVVPDIIDLIPIPISSNENDTVRSSNRNVDAGSSRSRRSLNIPPTTLPPESSYMNSALPSLKRQSISSVKSNIAGTDSRQNIDRQCNFERKNDPALELDDEVLLATETYNGAVQNGDTNFEGEHRQRSVTDSEAEDADTITELPSNASIHSILKPNTESQRTAGLFNMSRGNSRSGSRTSSFGNGLNFYTHLEGRKSLFSGNNGNNNLGKRTNLVNPLNSSTHSLNSLSRRQFNASIYGSTSALSDSRLLNTSSPFYKGNTTYGGAAAYSKFAGLGSNSRLTPTLIRPTSSLSTLSSSSNSIAAGIGGSSSAANAAGDQNQAISGSTKTILDILQSFTTPLSEVKKMASGIRQPSLSASTSMQSLQSKRLCDDDLNASRAMRLQNVSKPYARNSVLLQPKKTTSSSSKEPMPPVRELQVPSMSQLLQLKKTQSLTERSRQIMMQKQNNAGTSIPAQSSQSKTDAKRVETPQQQKVYNLRSSTDSIEQHTETTSEVDNSAKADCSKQQKHVNKIKNKIGSTLRSGTDLSDESPPVPANLPNVAFPLMVEMPKIDIELPGISKNGSPPTSSSSSKSQETKSKPVAASPRTLESDSQSEFKFSSPEALQNMPSAVNGIEPAEMDFEFSAPTPVAGTINSGITTNNLNFKNSSEGSSSSSGLSTTFFPLATKVNESKSPLPPPPLKTGSVIEALKKPLELPKISNSMETKTNQTSNSLLQPLSAFGSQFKKASNEWECDTCMLRNKESAQKCVACEVPRKGASANNDTATTATAAGFKSSASLSIAPDSGFKSLAAAQKASKWECEACMTQNDSSRSKCACCEQPKAGADGGESTKSNASTFSFGATAASKFSFGFNASAPDPAKQNAAMSNHLGGSSSNTMLGAKNADAESTTTGAGKLFGFGTGTAAAAAMTSKPKEGFNFGFQTTTTTSPRDTNKIASTESKDTSDGAVKTGAFNFGFGNSANTTNSQPTTSANISKEQTPATTSATTTTALTTVSTFASPKVTAFTFGSASSATPSTAPTTMTTTTTKPQEDSPFRTGFTKVANNPIASPAVTTATSSSESKPPPFPMFGTTPMGTGIASTTAATSISAVTSTTSSTAATVAPAFSFGVVSTSATSTTTSIKPMFSFGGSAMPSAITTGGVSSSSSASSATPVAITKSNETSAFQLTTTTAAGASTAKSPFSLNPNSNATFGAFGSPKINSQSDITTATTKPTTATTPAPTFGSFSFGSSNAAKTENTNLFAFSAPKAPKEESKPAAAAIPIFGVEPKATTTSNTLPKNTFHFGATTTNPAPAPAPAPATASFAPKLVFGSSAATPSASETSTTSQTSSNAPMASIFGNVGATSSSSTPTFGSSANASSAIFGSPANAGASTTANYNLFGSNNNNSTVPQFGAGIMGGSQATLGGNNATASTAPAFGSSASIGFGSFGAASAAAAITTNATSTTNTQPAAPAFAFGAPQPQPQPLQPSNSGFNFGATAQTRPSFNFSSTNQPTFNFSGSSGTETSQNTARPFQFGAAATAPSVNVPSVFSFGGAPPTEATSNTPFQFNAGSAQPTSNIFAPPPSTTPTTTPAARRKCRNTNRRLQPR